MAKMTAIEWDDQQARVMVARVSGERVQIDRVLEVSLDGEDGTPAEALAARLSEAKIGKGEAIINVGRAGTELRMLEVPRVPEDELPPIVRFQALRQFSAMTDDWKLDFIKQPVPEISEQLRVLAVALSPQLFEQIEAGCEASGLRPVRMLSRPFTLAMMFNTLLPSEATRLCIDPIGDEADLLVLRGDEVDLVRTTRLARNDAGEINLGQLVAELRRTLMAYRSQPDAQEITQFVICGGESELALADQLQSELKIDATVFDPFQMVELSGEAASALASNRRRFTGLIGAVLDTADFSDTRIDFLNPRKPPEDTGSQRRNNLVAAIVALIIVSLIGAGWMHNYLLNSKVRRLTRDVNNLRDGHKRVVQDVEDIKKIDEFAQTTRLNWLEQISYVSRELPRDEVIVDGFSGIISTKKVGRDTETEGVLQFSGRAKNAATMEQIEINLRDEQHEVYPGARSDEIVDAREYRWGFSERVVFGIETESNGSNETASEVASNETEINPEVSQPEETVQTESSSGNTPLESDAATDLGEEKESGKIQESEDDDGRSVDEDKDEKELKKTDESTELVELKTETTERTRDKIDAARLEALKKLAESENKKSKDD